MPTFGPTDPTWIKPWEIQDDKVIINPDLVLLKNNPNWKPKPYVSYLWVLKNENSIYMGIETQVTPDHAALGKAHSQQGYGHPTLTEGEQALYAGELLYKNGKWIINGASGRYGRSDVPVIASMRLRQAKRLFLQLIELEVSISEYEVRNA